MIVKYSNFYIVKKKLLKMSFFDFHFCVICNNICNDNESIKYLIKNQQVTIPCCNSCINTAKKNSIVCLKCFKCGNHLHEGDFPILRGSHVPAIIPLIVENGKICCIQKYCYETI